MLKYEFMPVILFCLDHALFTPKGVNNARLLQESESFRLFETTRSLSEYILLRTNLLISLNRPLCLVKTQLCLVEHKCSTYWRDYKMKLSEV